MDMIIVCFQKVQKNRKNWLMPSVSPLEVDEVKEGKGLKVLTPKKLLNRLAIVLAQIKSGNNLYKLTNQIRQILYLCISIINLLKKFKAI